MVQRFPLQVELEPEALRIANNYANHSNFTRPFLGLSFTSQQFLVQIALILVIGYLIVHAF